MSRYVDMSIHRFGDLWDALAGPCSGDRMRGDRARRVGR
jgi:hypothetical protein